MTIICEDVCKVCNQRFRKEPENLGDYYAGVLLRFCPECGQMLPFLSISDKVEGLSGNVKRLLGVRVAKTNKLDYSIMSDIIKTLKEVSDRKEFIEKFRIEIKKTFNLELEKDSFEYIL